MNNSLQNCKVFKTYRAYILWFWSLTKWHVRMIYKTVQPLREHCWWWLCEHILCGTANVTCKSQCVYVYDVWVFFPPLLLNVLLRHRTPCGLRSMWVGLKLALAVIVSSWVTLHTVRSLLTFVPGVYFTSLVIAIHVVTFQKLTGPALP